jgi:hypothetical protein
MQYLTDNSDRVMQRGDEISDCDIYRYWLWREWDRTGPTLAIPMLNPPRADHLADNPAIARKGCVAVFGGHDRVAGTERLIVLAETREAEATARDRLRSLSADTALELPGALADEIILGRVHTT